jgi:tetratricopeptide (TPR) repeat protein
MPGELGGGSARVDPRALCEGGRLGYARRMRRDRLGLPVTTASPAALAAYDDAVEGLLGWDGAAGERFARAADADPGLAVAHAGAAVTLFLDERFVEARAAAERARAAAASATPRERSHVEALARFVGGRTVEAESLMREHLAAHPRDLVIVQRLYFVWFWQGRFPEMLGLTAGLVRHHPGGSFMLGLHAFALEEAGRVAEALGAAESAIRRNPRDAWAVHALAHTVYEMGASAAGIGLLPRAIHLCGHLGWFRNHLVWHLALMHLAIGDYRRARTLARTVFERKPSAVPGDLHDAISLLWRLGLAGIEVADAWRPFAAIAAARLGRQGLLFHAAHLAMALAAGGDWATAERQLAMLRARAPRDETGLVGAVLVPLVEGLHAFAAQDYARAIDRLEPLRPRIVELGGSRAQRDVFHDTLLEACFRAKDVERAGRLLAERLARRPDAFWLARATP